MTGGAAACRRGEAGGLPSLRCGPASGRARPTPCAAPDRSRRGCAQRDHPTKGRPWDLRADRRRDVSKQGASAVGGHWRPAAGRVPGRRRRRPGASARLRVSPGAGARGTRIGRPRRLTRSGSRWAISDRATGSVDKVSPGTRAQAHGRSRGRGVLAVGWRWRARRSPGVRGLAAGDQAEAEQGGRDTHASGSSGRAVFRVSGEGTPARRSALGRPTDTRPGRAAPAADEAVHGGGGPARGSHRDARGMPADRRASGRTSRQPAQVPGVPPPQSLPRIRPFDPNQRGFSRGAASAGAGSPTLAQGAPVPAGPRHPPAASAAGPDLAVLPAAVASVPVSADEAVRPDREEGRASRPVA